MVLNYEEVGALSLDLLRLMEAEKVPRGLAIGALVLSALRIISPKAPLSEEEETQLTTEAIEWMALRVMPSSEVVH